MIRLLLFLISGALLVGCGDGDPLETSCGGDVVPNCRVYEYSVMRTATLTPDAIELGDPGAEAQVRVEFDSCGEQSPQPLEVVIRLLGSTSGGVSDASTERIFNLVTLKDDGSTFGDTVAMDGEIEVTIPNPFGTELPSNSDVTLRFEPRLNTCAGEVLEAPYRTGRRWSP